MISKELESKIQTITAKNLFNILENQSKQEIDLDEDEDLIFNINEIQILKIESQIISILELKTSKKKSGFYKIITDLEVNLQDEFFVIK